MKLQQPQYNPMFRRILFIGISCLAISLVGEFQEAEACPHKVSGSRRRVGPLVTHNRALQLRRWAQSRGCWVSYTFPCYRGQTRGYCFNVFARTRTRRTTCPVRGTPGTYRKVGAFFSYQRAIFTRRWAALRGCSVSKLYVCYRGRSRGYCFNIYFRRR